MAFVLFPHAEQVQCLPPRFPRLLPLGDWWTGKGFLFVCLFANLTQARVIWEEGISVEKMSPSDRSVGKSVGVFSRLIINVRGPSPQWVEPPWAGGPRLCEKVG